MRKVKFTQDSFDEKLGAILTEFPMLDVGLGFFFHDPSDIRYSGLASFLIITDERSL